MTPAASELTDLSPGIARTVLWLRAQGFDTCDSGDGSNAAAGMECALPFANVSMIIDVGLFAVEAYRLLELVRARGVVIEPQSPDEASPSIQVTFDPVTQVCILSLFGVTDAMLKL